MPEPFSLHSRHLINTTNNSISLNIFLWLVVSKLAGSKAVNAPGGLSGIEMPFKSLFYSSFKKSVRDKQLFCDLDKAAKILMYIEVVAKKICMYR